MELLHARGQPQLVARLLLLVVGALCVLVTGQGVHKRCVLKKAWSDNLSCLFLDLNTNFPSSPPTLLKRMGRFHSFSMEATPLPVKRASEWPPAWGARRGTFGAKKSLILIGGRLSWHLKWQVREISFFLFLQTWYFWRSWQDWSWWVGILVYSS